MRKLKKKIKVAVFWLCFAHPSHTILMPLHTQGTLWAQNDCAKIYVIAWTVFEKFEIFIERSGEKKTKRYDGISSRFEIFIERSGEKKQNDTMA